MLLIVNGVEYCLQSFDDWVTLVFRHGFTSYQTEDKREFAMRVYRRRFFRYIVSPNVLDLT